MGFPQPVEPTGAAGGVLTGTYPNPTFADPASFSSTAYPVVRSNRTTTGLNDYAAALAIRHTSTGGAMTDGYGAAISFELVDTDAIVNAIGTVGFVRSGADNTSAFLISTAVAGVVTERVRINSTTINVAEGINLAFGTTTGSKLGTLGTAKIGHWGVTPVVRPSAWTQTYATTSKTVANPLAVAVSTTGATNVTPFGYTTAAQANAITTNLNGCILDIAAIKDNFNALVDDLQLIGIAQ